MPRISRRTFIATTASAATSLSIPNIVLGAGEHDVAILNGRVIDPETKFDGIRHVAIRGSKIVAISRKEMRAKRVIDARGHVVCPGFIDLIAHGQDLFNDHLQAFDGVTTKLQMENGVEEQDAWHKRQAGTRAVNYGAGCSHQNARIEVFGNRSDAVDAVANDAQIQRIATNVDRELRKGALGVGFGLEYQPASTRWEVLKVIEVAGKYGASIHSHTRYGTLLEEESNLTALQEMISLGLVYGAPVHILHVPSMALANTGRALKLIEDAQKRGLDVTCDFYPYTAFGTGIASEVFAPGWQKKFGIDYKDVEWAKTHERLTEETFKKFREEGGFVIAHAIPESAVRRAVTSPATMVASDGAIRDGVGHPRAGGTFARVLGHYSRDLKLISLNDAIAKMTIQPAKRMAKRAPGFAKKGRIQIGCDADICVFNPKTILDKATFSEPAARSVGVSALVVNGQLVIRNGTLNDALRAGKPVKGVRK